jgi:hypothetical protein
MQKFSTVDLDQQLGNVKAAASRAPVVITEHRKDRFVLMHIDKFNLLKAKANPRKVYGKGETPKKLEALFTEEIDRTLAALK